MLQPRPSRSGTVSAGTVSAVTQLTVALLLATGVACQAQNTTNFPAIGHIDRFDPALDQLVAAEARIEVLCGGFEWSEGPAWVPEQGNKFGGFVLFSDIPHNAVMKWQESVGASIFLKPSGYTGAVDYGKEPGSNGLALDATGRLRTRPKTTPCFPGVAGWCSSIGDRRRVG